MQIIYYGAPGTGKSYEVSKLLRGKGVTDDYIFRVTFHPEYTYSDFTGQLLPTVVRSGPHKGDITYEFQKGIFTQALEKAYQDTSKEVYLIIEEMSRGNCAAIFGDIFQLLDRQTSGVDKGYSRYFVNNDVIARDIIALTGNRVKLPANFSIIGTVNTSDQNVFVMDTAFKRRFDWEYISTKPVTDASRNKLNNVDIDLFDGTNTKVIKWTDFYGVLNIFVASDRWLGLGEDKQVGQFFIEFDMSASKDVHMRQIKNKLLHYLWFDVQQSVFKSGVKIFDDSISSFTDLYDCFENRGKVFSDRFFQCISDWEKGIL